MRRGEAGHGIGLGHGAQVIKERGWWGVCGALLRSGVFFVHLFPRLDLSLRVASAELLNIVGFFCWSFESAGSIVGTQRNAG